jgi:hypothetical protein
VLNNSMEGTRMTTKHKRKEGEIEFKLLLAVTMPVFFVTTFIKRVLPWNWGRDKRSLFEATRCAAYSTIPFAFM